MNKLVAPNTKHHSYILVTLVPIFVRTTTNFLNVNQPSIKPLKLWYPPHSANLPYTWHLILLSSDAQVSIGCTIRLNANFSRRIWKMNLYGRVPKCVICTKNESKLKHKRRLQHFPAAKLLYFVAMHILILLAKLHKGTSMILLS